MAEEERANKLKTIDALIDWSKWLITLDFATATGCTIVLKSGVGDAVKPYLFLAIACFVVSTSCATLFVLLLTRQIPKMTDSALIQYRILANTQLLLFITGLVSLLVWIGKLSLS